MYQQLAIEYIWNRMTIFSEEISKFCDYDLKFVKKVQESMMQTV
jgi:hypothetical protein